MFIKLWTTPQQAEFDSIWTDRRTNITTALPADLSILSPGRKVAYRLSKQRRRRYRDLYRDPEFCWCPTTRFKSKKNWVLAVVVGIIFITTGQIIIILDDLNDPKERKQARSGQYLL